MYLYFDYIFQSFKIPAEWSEEIDLNSMLVITK